MSAFKTCTYIMSKGAKQASATVPWHWLFFCPAPKIHNTKQVHILGKNSQIPEVALVDFTPDQRQCKFLFQNGYYVFLIPTYIPSLVWTVLKKYTDLEFFENVIHTTISSSLKDVNKMSCIEIWQWYYYLISNKWPCDL